MPVATVTKQSKQLICDQFQLPKGNWTVNEDAESNSKVDGVNVLARMVGEAFLIDGVSLNNRIYTKKLWENAIAKVNEKLHNGGLLGTIGHDQALDEKALLEGKISHIVTDLKIDEKNKVGLCEILVLGTESGKQLNTMLRAGVQLPVSTRAYGQVSGKGPMGEDIIDEDSFLLEGIDIVLSPGVPTAYPKVVENVNQEDDNQMNEQLVEKLATEKLELTEKLTEVLTENQKTAEAIQKLQEENKKLRDAVVYVQKHVGKISEVKAIKEGLLKFLTLPPFEKIAKFSGLTDNVGDNVKKLGLAAESLKTLPTKKQVSELKAHIAKYEEMGSLAEVAQAEKLLRAYAKFGSPAKIAEKLSKTATIKAKVLEACRKSAARKIGEALDTPNDVVLNMLKVMPVKNVISNLRKMRESNNWAVRTGRTINESRNEGTQLVETVKSGPASLAANLFASKFSTRS